MLFDYCQVVMLLLLLYLSKYTVSVLNFILLKYFVNNKYIYLLLINFSYNKSINCQDTKKKHFLLYYLKNALTKSLSLLFNIIVIIK